MSAVAHPLLRRRRGLWQLTLLLGVLFAYSRVRGLSRGSYDDALANADEVLTIQTLLGLPKEAGIQAWAAAHGPLMSFLSWSYLLAHFAGTALVFLLTYRYRPRSFYWLRDTWMVASAIALPFYALLPTAPPRLTAESGLHDSVTQLTPFGLEEGTASAFYHPYAAIPSMHVGTALLVAVALSLGHRIPTRLALMVYPAFVTFTVVATGNHYWLDAVAGAAVAVVAMGVVWIWRHGRDEQAAPFPVALAPTLKT